MTFEDLEVYKKLFQLSFEIYKITLNFPKFEIYELGSQLRRSSNSCPANLAESFANKHTKIYLEGISRTQGELRETKHHLRAAYIRNYIDKEKLELFIKRYEECSKMLYGLEKAIIKS